MKIPALIMAGGKGKRIGLPVEKPLLHFLGKPLMDWVAEAVLSATKISEMYIITSQNTPQTEKYSKDKGWKILRTDANGYHNDLKQAVNVANLHGPILTMPADLPAITGEFLDHVIEVFEKCGKDFLAVFVPINIREKLRLSVSSTDEHKGVWHAVSGVNIINGDKIREEGKIETDAIISEEIEVLLNINTLDDLKISEKLFQEYKTK